MKKYYCLTLFGSYEINHTIACYLPCTQIQDVLEKEYTTLDFETLRDDFLIQDEKIVIREDSWIVRGAFPVIAEEQDGQLVDIITGEVYEEYDGSLDKIKAGKLTYTTKSLATNQTVETLLESIDEVGKKMYTMALNGIRHHIQVTGLKLETPRYFKLQLRDIDAELSARFPIYAQEMNGAMIEVVTEEPIHYAVRGILNARLTYKDASLVSAEEVKSYLDCLRKDEEKLQAHTEFLRSQRLNNSITYNNYTTMDIPRISKEKMKEQKNTPKRKRLIEEEMKPQDTEE